MKTRVFGKFVYFTCTAVASLICSSARADYLYVTAQNSMNANDVVEQIDNVGNITTFANGLGAPRGATFDSANNLYVSDFGNNRIFRYTPAGIATTVPLTDTFNLVVGASGTIFSTQPNHNTVSAVTALGASSVYASGFSTPFGIAIDAMGRLYVANLYGGISLVSTSGVVSTYATGLTNPSSLVFDSTGNLYVAVGNGSVVKITPGGAQSTFATGLGSIAQLAIDSTGNLFTANNADGTIRKVTPAGVTSIYASGLGFPEGLAITTVPLVSPGLMNVPEPSSFAVISAALLAMAIGFRSRWHRRTAA